VIKSGDLNYIDITLLIPLKYCNGARLACNEFDYKELTEIN
jgi:hypothetical protein